MNRVRQWSAALGRWLGRVWTKIWQDPVALTALVLSLFAAAAQLAAWVRGPSVRLIVPNGVALFVDMAPDRSLVFMRIAADMSYANVAQQAFGTVVTGERATLSVAGAETRQKWNSFGTIDRSGVRQTGMAAPQALPGQSAVTHFTLFAPVPLDCLGNQSDCEAMSDYLSRETFAERLAAATELIFRFEIETIDGEVHATSCQVPLGRAAREQLSDVVAIRARYFYAACRSKKS